jgi:hypothetical protein
MKVDRKQAVALMVSLEFTKASEWDDEKLKARLKMVPEKVAEDKVGDEFKSLYGKLVDAPAEEIELTGVEEKEEDEAKEKSKTKGNKVKETPKTVPSGLAKKVKDMDKASLRAFVEEHGLEVKFPSKAPVEKMRELVAAALKKAKPAAKPATPTKKVEKDKFGCRLGTFAAKVNAVLTPTWQGEEEIAEAAKITLDQARGRLYYAAVDKVVESRRRVEYRLVPSKKKEA